MKKIITLMLAVLMVFGCAVSMASCKKDDDKDDKKTKTYIMGFDADFPPYCYTNDDGKSFEGFDVEYATEVFKRLGYKLELKAIEWDSKDQMLETGAIDFIWNGFTYEGREEKYAWTDRYFNNSIVVITLDDGIKTLDDLAGKKVAVQSDSSGETALEKNTALTSSFAGGKFETEGAYTTACSKMVAGDYDAIVVDFGVANYLMAQNSNIKKLNETVATETYGVGFRKDDTDLCKEINDMMKTVAKENDGKFIKDLCTKYNLDYEAFLLK